MVDLERLRLMADNVPTRTGFAANDRDVRAMMLNAASEIEALRTRAIPEPTEAQRLDRCRDRAATIMAGLVVRGEAFAVMAGSVERFAHDLLSAEDGEGAAEPEDDAPAKRIETVDDFARALGGAVEAGALCGVAQYDEQEVDAGVDDEIADRPRVALLLLNSDPPARLRLVITSEPAS